MKLWFVSAALCVALASKAAFAEGNGAPVTVQVEGSNVTLAPPENACAYDKANPMDAKALQVLEKAMRGANEVIFAFADCRDIEAMRAGREQTTGDYGQIMFPTVLKRDLDLSRREFVDRMTDFFKAHGGIFDESGQTFAQTQKALAASGMRINNSRILGVIHSDPDLMQVGMMQSIQTRQRAGMVIGVITATKLGVPVTVNFYHPSSGADSEKVLHDLSERAAAYARRLIALNPDTVLPHADERGEDRYRALGMSLGVLMVLGAVIAIVRMRRKAP
jgi:hypothetical protein